jgi:hypothetical protein
MYKEHPVFIQPDNEDIKVWRYMDFTKFVSLIDTRRLFFTRADKFEDPFEGSWPKINVDARKEALPELKSKDRDEYLKMMESSEKYNKEWRRFNAVNCWHANEHESAAMWKLYLKSDEGIAIQSTYRLLKKSIIDDETVYIGKVKYIDYETEYIDARNLLSPFVHKRKSFEHEKEIRGVVLKWPQPNDGALNLEQSQDTIHAGIPIKVDLETLVQKIYVSPNAPNWLADLVIGAVKKYGYEFEVIHSKMNSSPLF